MPVFLGLEAILGLQEEGLQVPLSSPEADVKLPAGFGLRSNVQTLLHYLTAGFYLLFEAQPLLLPFRKSPVVQCCMCVVSRCFSALNVLTK